MAKKSTSKSGQRKRKAVSYARRWRKIAAVGIWLWAILLALSMLSYLWTWNVDQDRVLSEGWKMLWSGEVVIANMLGRFGALVASLFIYWGFGIMAFLWVPLFFQLGRDVLRGSVHWWKWGVYHRWVVAMLYGSVVAAFLMHQSAFPWGGATGAYIVERLNAAVGHVGTALLLIFISVAYLIWKFDLQIENWQLAVPEGFSLRLWKLRWRGQDSIATTVDDKITGASQSTDVIDSDSEVGYEMVDEPYIAGESTSTEAELGDPLGTARVDLPRSSQVEEPSGDVPIEIVDQKSSAATVLPPETSFLEQSRDQEDEAASESKGSEAASLRPYDPREELPDYVFPDLSLLKDYDQRGAIQKEELIANQNKIIETLSHYGIQITKIRATIGPTVTLYEIVPAKGVRISRIKNLVDDIAMSLSALGIRIIAPIPGRGTIGIEVPNKNPQIVSLKEVLGSDKFQQNDMELPISLGKTISNEVFVADLAKMPHLLVAGATGQGKSVGLNVILMSLLYKKHPAELKLVLIDPKKVELPIYNDLRRHFLAFLPDQEEPIITDTDKVIYTLNSLVIEMEERYELLKKARVRNIKEYNKKFRSRLLNPAHGHRFLPYLVLVIDEFADLIMTAGKEIELPLSRLAQLARAVGIHLIIATQRPTVKIITGLIKANFPVRIAYRVTSQVDSRTIIDQSGAEQLIGRGDMLLMMSGHLVRLQCAYVETSEIENVVGFIARQRGFHTPFLLPEYHSDDTPSSGNEGIKSSELDPMFREAARLVVQHQHGSTSMIQRRLKLGYNRAGRIMDQLELLGIVGSAEGSKPREVYVYSLDELERIFENIYGK